MSGESVRDFVSQASQIIPIKRPFSNFNLIEKRFDGIWSLRRIFSQIRQMGGIDVIIEDVSLSPDLAEENADIKMFCPGFDDSKSYAARISFFSTEVDKNFSNVLSDAFLGYAVFKRDIIPPTPGIFPVGNIVSRVYESVIRTSRHDNNFIRGAPEWKCRVAGRNISITGYLYAQQNGITNSCAHVAVRTAATRFSDEDISYHQINNWVKQYRSVTGATDDFPGKGLSNDEICYILEKAGARTFVGDYSKLTNAPVSYQKYLYGAIESGFPAILFFGCDEREDLRERPYHCIPIFGHTFNEDTWVADANFMYFPYTNPTKSLSSGTWVSMFIGHDDNAGSNFCIPNYFIQSQRICQNEKGESIDCKHQPSSVAYAIGTLPEGVQVNPIEAEAIGGDYLLTILQQIPDDFAGGKKAWQQRLAWYHEQNLLVLRTILLAEGEYARHLEKVKSWRFESFPEWLIKIMRQFSDSNVWMIELSVPELFSANRRKIGEILIRAEEQANTARDFKNFLFARLPGCFVFLKEEEEDQVFDPSQPQFLFLPINIDDHVELFGCEENSNPKIQEST